MKANSSALLRPLAMLVCAAFIILLSIKQPLWPIMMTRLSSLALQDWADIAVMSGVVTALMQLRSQTRLSRAATDAQLQATKDGISAQTCLAMQTAQQQNELMREGQRLSREHALIVKILDAFDEVSSAQFAIVNLMGGGKLSLYEEAMFRSAFLSSASTAQLAAVRLNSYIVLYRNLITDDNLLQALDELSASSSSLMKELNTHFPQGPDDIARQHVKQHKLATYIIEVLMPARLESLQKVLVLAGKNA